MSNATPLDAGQRATLAKLADGILPPDETDAGAGAVDAGARLAEKVDAGVNQALYLNGLQRAEALARSSFGDAVGALDPARLHELVGVLRSELPGFYKQLRMDVCAVYLSDPAVWARIGFPGPSAERGGHPDFDHRPRPKQGRTAS